MTDKREEIALKYHVMPYIILQKNVTRESGVVSRAVIGNLLVVALFKEIGCCLMEVIAHLLGVVAVAAEQIYQIFAEAEP